MVEPVRVYLGLGSNQDRPLEQLARAVRELEKVVAIDTVSSVYLTEPVGFSDQPDFMNVVVSGTTVCSPEALLDEAQRVEEHMGRVRTFRNAPRVIDVDVLAFGEIVAESPRLTLPHPGVATRGFVLHPLAEIAPGWRHPVTGETPRELLARAGGTERVERVGALPPYDAR